MEGIWRAVKRVLRVGVAALVGAAVVEVTSSPYGLIVVPIISGVFKSMRDKHPASWFWKLA